MVKKSIKTTEKKPAVKAVKVAKAPRKVAKIKVAPAKEAKAVKKEVVEEKIVAKPVKKATKSKTGKNDTGSIDFQITNFTKKIKVLTDHLKEHKHDFDSRRGLLIMVGKRRRLLNYLRKTEPEKYLALIKELKLKR